MFNNFDYIIIGAGSAGCVLARKLSDHRDVKVLLLEAGGQNYHPFISMPRGFSKMLGKPKYFWKYSTKAFGDQASESWHYGKGMGGSSAINGMWYMRGMPSDFEAWERAGNLGWGWDAIVHTYKSIERYRESGAHKSRGIDGPLEVTQQVYQSPVISAMISAGQEIGLPVLQDINQPNTEGIGFSQFTVDRMGRRGTSYTSFIKPIEPRTNLVIRHNCEVTRIIIKDGRAHGVVCSENGVECIYNAKCEVILSAGVIQSPKLLQLSGIGPVDLLNRHGIPVLQALEAVGCNLADHPMIAITYDLKNDPNLHRELRTYRLYLNVVKYYLGRPSLMATAAVPVTVLMSTEGKKFWPNIQLGLVPCSIQENQSKNKMSSWKHNKTRPGIMFLGYDLRPRGRGEVKIISADYRVAPKISMDWGENPEDRTTQKDIVQTIRRFASSKELSPYCGEEIIPSEPTYNNNTNIQELKPLVKSGLHGCGTCRMGSDSRFSVVDSQLRVHGVSNLRIVDASIMPTPISGNTNAIAMVIGAKAADFIIKTRELSI